MSNVAILGASNDPDRIAHLTQSRLVARGHRVFPVALNDAKVSGLPAYRRLGDIQEAIDTLTIYVNRHNLIEQVAAILALKPHRVIFNPGTESPDIAKRLEASGIKTENACTLVLLRTGQFD